MRPGDAGPTLERRKRRDEEEALDHRRRRGGATAAARARRITETAEITVLERGPYVSYANCGLPYFLSRDIEQRSELLLATPEDFDGRYRVKALVSTEALEIDRHGKRSGRAARRVKRGSPTTSSSWRRGVTDHASHPGGRREPCLQALDGTRHGSASRSYRAGQAEKGGRGGRRLHRPRDGRGLCKRGIEVTVVELLPTVMAVMDASSERSSPRSSSTTAFTSSRVRA